MNRPIRSLLISADDPVEGYGTGQRLISLRRALDRLGECRFLHLVSDPTAPRAEFADYVAFGGVPPAASRRFWIERQLRFAEFRPDRRALAAVDRIFAEYRFDVALCHFFRSSMAAPLRRAPCLIDVDALPRPGSGLSRLLWPMTRWIMNRRAAQFSATFVIRPSDALVLDGVRAKVLPCISTSATTFIEPDPDAANVLFVGPTKWLPNREAAEFLIDVVRPRLAAAAPRFQIRLVGSGTEAYAGIAGVSAGGFVTDLAVEYRRAAVVVCPVWSGGGTNVKLAEALQTGCATVASAHAAAGFDGIVLPGRDVVVSQNRDEFAGKLIDLLADPQQMATLRRNARALAQTALSQAQIDRTIAAAVERALLEKETKASS